MTKTSEEIIKEYEDGIIVKKMLENINCITISRLEDENGYKIFRFTITYNNEKVFDMAIGLSNVDKLKDFLLHTLIKEMFYNYTKTNNEYYFLDKKNKMPLNDKDKELVGQFDNDEYIRLINGEIDEFVYKYNDNIKE